MIEARINPTDYKDWANIVEQLKAQGVAVDRSHAGLPVFRPPVRFVYDTLKKVFVVAQAS